MSEQERMTSQTSPASHGQRQPVSRRLMWLTRLLAWFCWAGVVFTLAMSLATAFGVLEFGAPRLHTGANGLFGSAITVGTENISEKDAGFYRHPFFLLALAFSTALYVWALISAARSLSALSHGAFFSHDAISGLRNLAFAVLLHMTLAPLAMMAARGAFVALHKHGSFEMSVGLHSSAILMLVFAGAVLAISSVMARAARIAEENEQFV